MASQKVNESFSEELVVSENLNNENNGTIASRHPSVPFDYNIGAMEDKIEDIVNRHNYEKSSLISILLDIQTEYNYLSKPALKTVAYKLGIPEIQVYSVATFYKVFSLEPRGKHLINVCLGTACHVRGGDKIVEEIQRKLDTKAGRTTEDGLFTIETVRCLGCCASGPVVVVDKDYYSEVTPKTMSKILDKYKHGGNS